MEKHNLRSVIATPELMGTVPSNSRRAVHVAAAFVLSSGLVAMSAQPVSAQMVVVPPGCGSYSGTLVPANKLDDHSLDYDPLGDIANGIPYLTQITFGMITIGTQFPDYIQGNNITGSAVDEVICGLDEADWLTGGSGNDEMFGGEGADSLWGMEGGDLLSGGLEVDVLYGDDPTSSGGIYDLGDTIQGGEGNDFLYGGEDTDTLRGGPGDDYADGGNDADTVVGGPDDDDLYGGEGNDILRGVTGMDDGDGGNGADTCTQIDNPVSC